jgi:hypothetical protein
MNTKILMISSAIFLAIIGILVSFFPNEIVAYLNIKPNIITIRFLKILSAFYLGFGILNWLAKGTLIGRIYNRLIAIGNLIHFGVGAIVLFKIVSNMKAHSEIIIVLTAVYVVFALLFVYVFKTNPIKLEK